MKFNPEDEQVTGPRCRNCHKGSSGCGACHNEDPAKSGVNGATDAVVAENGRASITHLFAAMFQMIGSAGFDTATVASYEPYTAYEMGVTSTDKPNEIAGALTALNGNGFPIVGQHKSSRTVNWSSGWRQDGSALDAGDVDAICSDDGFSWPHRTLGWKMLKDDLFGLDFDGTTVGVGDTRTYDGSETNSAGQALKAHDLDSVCLDCHNPTIWNDGQVQNKAGHTDDPSTTADDAADDLLLRGLP